MPSLTLDPGKKSMSQKKHNGGGDKIKSIIEEVRKLLEANYIKEIRYPTWLSNMVW